jgi:tetratricopeptide (TPR) repeat protein
MGKSASRVGSERVATLLGKHLREALVHLGDVTWLGQHSPLAQPAFLGGRLHANANQSTALQRGKALQALLKSAIASLSEHALEHRLLDLRYVQERPVSFVLDACHLSRTTHYRHEQRALELFETALLRQAVPSIQIHIPQRPDVFVGRAKLATICAEELRARKSIVLSGPIGAGKSTLAAWIAADWETRRVFWLTLREHLNDNLQALAHTLAYFLLQNGKLDAWLHLSVTSGALNLLAHIERFQALVIDGCRSIDALLVVDSLDVLRPLERAEHARMISFLSGLADACPAMFVGMPEQGLGALHVDAVHTLAPLQREAVADWVRTNHISATPDALAVALQITDGNAGALSLLLAFARDDGLDQALETAQNSPALLAMLQRVFARLSTVERRFVEQLAAFREPVFVVETQANLAIVERLGIVKRTRDGSMYVQPLLRRLIMSEMPIDRKRATHALAAEALIEGAQFAEAAYHHAQSGQPALALSLWVTHRDVEMDQGHATHALETLRQLDVTGFDSDTLQAWRLCVSDLHYFLGALDSAAAEFALLEGSADAAVSVFAAQRLARMDLIHRNPESAVKRLTEALLTREAQLGLAPAELRRTLATSLTVWRKIDEAWQAILSAECDVLFTKAYILGERAKFDDAVEVGRRALDIANELKGAGLIAKAQFELGGTLHAAGRYDEAVVELEQALAYYQSAGASVKTAECLDTIAAALVSAYHDQRAIEYAHRANEIFTNLGATEQAIGLEFTLALAHAHLGDLAQSQTYAEKTVARGDKNYLPSALHLLVYISARLGNTAAAIGHANCALAAASEAQDAYTEARIRLRLSQVLRQTGQLADAQREQDTAHNALRAMGRTADADMKL